MATAKDKFQTKGLTSSLLINSTTAHFMLEPKITEASSSIDSNPSSELPKDGGENGKLIFYSLSLKRDLKN